jgi:DNA excision repair protein ERCC-1
MFPCGAEMASSTSTTSGPVKPNVAAPSTNNIIGERISDTSDLDLRGLVSSTQRLNPVLEHVRNVGKEFGEIVADYQVGRTTGVLYLRCVEPIRIFSYVLIDIH